MWKVPGASRVGGELETSLIGHRSYEWRSGNPRGRVRGRRQRCCVCSAEPPRRQMARYGVRVLSFPPMTSNRLPVVTSAVSSLTGTLWIRHQSSLTLGAAYHTLCPLMQAKGFLSAPFTKHAGSIQGAHALFAFRCHADSHAG